MTVPGPKNPSPIDWSRSDYELFCQYLPSIKDDLCTDATCMSYASRKLAAFLPWIVTGSSFSITRTYSSLNLIRSNLRQTWPLSFAMWVDAKTWFAPASGILGVHKFQDSPIIAM